ncbi:MAG: prepilin-type N-terminal cleavage/methylation domain-containing protein [Planctomycetota bacterium]|nr:prepilin-type N-terminal cleavage/methylation domain-containing protein [Planctomycetota bacterium]
MKASKAFTLVELLTVIAIIGALLSILLPSLSRAREEAKRTVCASNEHGIGQAFYVYAQVVPNFFPAISPVFDAVSGNMQIFHPDDRTTSPSTASLPSPTVDMWAVVRMRYCVPKQFICPSTPDAPDPGQDTTVYFDFFSARNLSYAYQYQHDPDCTIIGAASEPTFPVLADANPYIKGGLGGGSPSLASDRNSAGRGNSTNHLNREGQNILFQDGHVDFERGPDVGLPGRAAGVQYSRGRDNIYSVHSWNAPVDPGTDKPFADPDGSPGTCNLGDKSDACLVP